MLYLSFHKPETRSFLIIIIFNIFAPERGATKTVV